MRGDRYGTNFPGARDLSRSFRHLRRAVADRWARARTAWMLRARHRRLVFNLLGTVKPGAVVGFGGYPAFPPLVAAACAAFRPRLHEQNAVLGRANRVLASHVTAVATSFDEHQVPRRPRAGQGSR